MQKLFITMIFFGQPDDQVIKSLIEKESEW